MKIRMLILLVTLSLALVACGSQADNNGSDDSNNDADTSNEAVDYSFSVTLNDDVTFTEEDVSVRDTDTPVPVIEISDGVMSTYFIRVEFDADEITASGEYEVSRVTVSFPSELGESGAVGCGSTEGTPDDVMMNVTEVDGNRLTGTLDVTLTGCDDFMSGDDIDMESATIVAQFTNIPFLPDNE
ncbi:MAG: hypothetical protein AAF846_05220 [Chloroflexota bacterium]